MKAEEESDRKSKGVSPPRIMPRRDVRLTIVGLARAPRGGHTSLSRREANMRRNARRTLLRTLGCREGGPFRERGTEGPKVCIPEGTAEDGKNEGRRKAKSVAAKLCSVVAARARHFRQELGLAPGTPRRERDARRLSRRRGGPGGRTFLAGTLHGTRVARRCGPFRKRKNGG